MSRLVMSIQGTGLVGGFGTSPEDLVAAVHKLGPTTLGSTDSVLADVHAAERPPADLPRTEPIRPESIPEELPLAGSCPSESFQTDSLSSGSWSSGSFSPAPHKLNALKADTSGLTDFVPPRALRRVDPFSRLALYGARLALADAGIAPEDLKSSHDCGIVIATGYGPAATTFDFLDSMLDHGAAMASPTAFSQSVHNIPAAVIAMNLGLMGPCSTVSQFETSVASALLTARLWLAEGRVKRVLFGAVDELTDILQENRLRLATEHSTGRATLPVGEGAAFFVLEAGTADSAGIHEITMGRPETIRKVCAGRHVLSDRPATMTNAASCACLAHAYGSMPVASAFDMALALCLPDRRGKETVCTASHKEHHAAITVRSTR